MAISKALAELIRVSVGPAMATSAYHYGVQVRQGDAWVPSRYFRTLAAARKWAARYAPARVQYHGVGVVVLVAEYQPRVRRCQAAAQADVAIAQFRARTSDELSRAADRSREADAARRLRLGS